MLLSVLKELSKVGTNSVVFNVLTLVTAGKADSSSSLDLQPEIMSSMLNI